MTTSGAGHNFIKPGKKECKICSAVITCPDELWFSKLCVCDQYMILSNFNNDLVEYVLFGDWELSFVEGSSMAQLVKFDEVFFETFIQEIKMTKLTPTLAKKWLAKMKTYQLLE